MSDLRDKIADAIASAEVGFRMELIRLEHGIHTYSLTYDDGERLEFCDEDTDEYNAQDRLYAHVRQRKRQSQADAVLAAIRVSEADLIGAEQQVCPECDGSGVVVRR